MLKKPMPYWIINNLSDYFNDELLLVRNSLKKKKTSTRRLFSKYKTNTINNKNKHLFKFDSNNKRFTNLNHIHKMTTTLDEPKIIDDELNDLNEREEQVDSKEEEEELFVVLKVNVRLNILNKNEAIRQKEQSLVMRVPIEKLSNEAHLDINLEDGVELANIDILEMDQDLELAEIDIIKLDKDENLNEKLTEIINAKKTENIELIEKLATELTLEQMKFQKNEEDRHAEEIKREDEITSDELNTTQDDDLTEEEIIEEIIVEKIVNHFQQREEKREQETQLEQEQNQIETINYQLEDEQLEKLLQEQLRREELEEKAEESLPTDEFDYISEEGKVEEEEFTRRNSLSFRNKNDRLDLLKLEKIIEEEEGTFGSSTEWEEEIEWEEEEADWDTNNDNEIKKINQIDSINDEEEEEKQWEKFDSELDSLLEPIWSQKETSTYLSPSSIYSPINMTSDKNTSEILKDNSLDYDEEEEYFTDLEDKTIRTTPSSFDEWDDLTLVGKTSDSASTTTSTNIRQNLSIENKINLDEKTLMSTIENLFQLIDYDQNGMIEFNDIIRVVFILNYLLGRNYSKTDAVVFFTTLDQDKDGKLDRKEFKNAFNFLFNY